MILDTDVLIWAERGKKSAADLIDGIDTPYISLQTYMELIQLAPSKKRVRLTQDFLKACGIIVLPLTEAIGHRAAIYIEELSMETGIRVGDALIAATAIEHRFPLVSGNRKHFRNINNLNLVVYRPV
ncbi:MAG: type II toxin-antitoxin system VapC family toxin [Candidatus Margulisiibacteriota bacterium]